ncbi:MAG: hypothetical protein ACI8U3_000371 [Brevundimonas sp.]|jgi:hypothetical protein|uniref:EF-hand domain-containing protein n=1 Tax=Brevundimonas sp. TaxID=1871086 RepID=UPI0039E2A855
MRKMIVLGGVAALAMSGAAIAQTNDEGQRGWRMDADARVSQAEFVDRRVARLTAMDANGDGVVAREEMQAQRQARMVERRNRMFERMDADSDGSITRAEYDASHAQRVERMAERRAERGEAGQRRGWRGHRGQRMGMRLDQGGQGVNIEQARQRATEQFGRMDADGDGFVTGAEMRAQREARRAERQARRAERRAQAAE